MTEEQEKQIACLLCKFYKPYKKNIGLCRRYAPRPVFTLTEDREDRTIWPEVYWDDWCGEFIQR